LMFRRVAAQVGCPKPQYRAFVFRADTDGTSRLPASVPFSPYAGHVGAQSKNSEIPAARCVCQNVLLSYHDSRCKP
jgi:hypothetical protein